MGRFPMHRILDLAMGRDRIELQSQPSPSIGLARARSLCVLSGKGGTGKSVVSASLGRILARMRRTVLVDGDLGVGNAHILQGGQPRASFAEHLAGRRRAEDLAVPCGGGLDLVAGGSGLTGLAELGGADLVRVGQGLAELERAYDYLLMDCGAGIGAATLAFARAADLVLLVVTPDLTALTDAYAVVKVLGLPASGPVPWVLINRAPDEERARDAYERLAGVSRRFLGRAPGFLGWLPEDPAVLDSVNGRRPLVEADPGSPAARSLGRLALDLRGALDALAPMGLGRRLATGEPLVRRA